MTLMEDLGLKIEVELRNMSTGDVNSDIKNDRVFAVTSIEICGF